MKYQRREVLGGIGSVLAAAALPALVAGGDERSVKPRIRVGQIGVGHAHATKLSVYRQSADYEVVGIVEPNRDLRQKAEKKAAFRDLTWMTQEELLNVPGLQAVLIETEVRELLDTAETCVAADKHIHLDKPAGDNLPQFKRILAAADAKERLIQMGYMYRYNPALVMLRDFLSAGWLGEVFEVHTVMSKVVDPSTRRQLATYPGGIMFELGCHIIDLVVGVLGAPDNVVPFARQSAEVDDRLIDNMLAVFEYPTATATVKSSAVEIAGFARRHFVVCGTEGTFHIQPLDNPTIRLALSQHRGKYRTGYQDIELPKYTRYVADAADMAQIIRGEKPSDFSTSHDLTVQTALLKACDLPLV